MKKNYIKLNIDDNHLSFGNLCRVIKELSKNKIGALQSEVFCLLFDVDSINDTTVNNYCVGVRGINDTYKQKYINYKKRYDDDKLVLLEHIKRITSLLEGSLVLDLDIKELNSNKSLKLLCNKLYNISKNDNSVTEVFMKILSDALNNNDLIYFMSEVLFFIILDKRQPIYDDEIKVEIIENVLNNTLISANDLKGFLDIKINEDVNYNYKLKKLSEEGNAYACFEMGQLESKGIIKGFSRYDEAYNYYLKAIESNYPQAYYMLGKLLVKGLYGSKTNEELELGFNYIKKSSELGSIAGTNLLAQLYMNGIYPIKKDIDKAIKLFKEAAAKDYSYAYNNLYVIYKDSDPKLAQVYLEKSASLNESWALNKIGEEYRLKGDLKSAYSYYSKSAESPNESVCFYSYYNLAKYFYLNGNGVANIASNYEAAIMYFNLASNGGILDASIELLKIYISNYKKNPNNKDYSRVLELLIKIEENPKYNNDIKNNVESIISDLTNCTINSINIKRLLD